MYRDPIVDATDGHQTRPPGWPAAELDPFADALESVLAAGNHDLAALVNGLNAAGVAAPDGGVWTDDALRRRLADLDRTP